MRPALDRSAPRSSESTREALALQQQALAEARAALEAERQSRADLERALASERKRGAELQGRLKPTERTVARLIAADEPPRYRRAPKGSMLDPLEPLMRTVLRDRPGIDAAGMTEVLRTHGYRRSVDLVRRRLRRLRSPS